MNSKHKNYFLKRRFLGAFSLVELMISLIVVSIVAATFAPVITKKLSSNSVVAGATKAITSIRSDCDSFNSSGGICSVCTDSLCLSCTLDNCDESQGKYKNIGKCQCEDCSLRSTNCIKCNSKDCTKCSESYYLDSNKKCQACPSGKYCDGSSNPMVCTKINSNCQTCSSSSICTKCNSGYYLNSTKTSCTKCEAGNYCNGQTKTACADKQYSLAGASSCSIVTTVTNCATYSKTENKCTACNSGYYLSNNTCQKCPTGSYCNGTTKTTCSNGQYTDSEGNSSCQTCPAGYYCKNGSKTACGSKQYSSSGATSCSSSTTVSNCSTYSTTENKCTACNSGYALSGNKCESAGYAKLVYGLYVTKYNMGDNTSTQIPSAAGVTVVNAGSSCSDSKCCWKGSTSLAACDAKNGVYSGCNRTVCNWSAANAICTNYKQDNRTWRLATSGEIGNWASYSIGKSSEGLMLCDSSSGYSSAYCGSASQCNGGSANTCEPSYVWGHNRNLVFKRFWYLSLAYGEFSKGYHSSTNTGAYYSVRCVSDSIANCSTYSEANACTKCKTNYYLKNGKCNAVTPVEGCTSYSATEDKCIGCNEAYNLSNNKCVFACQGSYFLKLSRGICVTKYNMGDSTSTAIPSSLGISLTADRTACSQTGKCCWASSDSSSDCSLARDAGDYSGCERTVCTWATANAICSNYKFGRKTWRLPTNSEGSEFNSYSRGKGSNGLMLCIDTDGYYDMSYCSRAYGCGSSSNACYPYHVWYDYNYSSHYGSYRLYERSKDDKVRWSTHDLYSYEAASVRCVTSM